MGLGHVGNDCRGHHRCLGEPSPVDLRDVRGHPEDDVGAFELGRQLGGELLEFPPDVENSQPVSGQGRHQVDGPSQVVREVRKDDGAARTRRPDRRETRPEGQAVRVGPGGDEVDRVEVTLQRPMDGGAHDAQRATGLDGVDEGQRRLTGSPLGWRRHPTAYLLPPGVERYLEEVRPARLIEGMRQCRDR